VTIPIFETARLRLRPYDPGDRGWFVRTFSDPLVMRNVGGALGEAAAGALFDGICGLRDHPRVFCAWCAEREGELVGHGALLNEGGDLELGYVLPRSFWGRGYATEIAAALTRHVLVTLGRPRLIATVDEDHPPSVRVLEKIGMSFRERIEDPEGAYLLYAIDRS